MANADRRRDRATRGCPLGAFSSVDNGPGLLVGALAMTGGRCGSVTSASVKTGFGASAGGNEVGLIIDKRPAG